MYEILVGQIAWSFYTFSLLTNIFVCSSDFCNMNTLNRMINFDKILYFETA